MLNNALYYPSIDIADEEWLKTAYLFWDKIFTITPESMVGRAYNNYMTQYLEGEGFLRPISVNPDSPVVKGLVKDVKSFARTEEGMACLNQKLPDDIYSNPYDDARSEFYLHHEKLAFEIQELVGDRIGEDGWARVSNNFANYYMTLLANRIANQQSMSLVTSSSLCDNFSNSVSVKEYRRPFSLAHIGAESIGKCMLTKMIIDGIIINPLTSIEDLRCFKERHIQELRNFRVGLEELSQMDLPSDITLEGIEQMARYIYENKVMTAYQDLKDSLKGAGIHFTMGGVAAIVFTDISTSFNELLKGSAEPVRLAIGAGAILAYKGYQTVKDIQGLKRNNKMSYLLSIDRELGGR